MSLNITSSTSVNLRVRMVSLSSSNPVMAIPDTELPINSFLKSMITALDVAEIADDMKSVNKVRRRSVETTPMNSPVTLSYNGTPYESITSIKMSFVFST